MCGIAGIVAVDVALHEPLDRMLDALEHRGPDDRGEFRGQGVSVGHRRLAIIDLSPGGHQPMATPDGRFVLDFNGEIYNYIELRAELEAAGRRFRTESDTEVLLTAWAHWGESCLDRLIGMFAFAIVDLERRTVSLVRDQFGIKPLFFSATRDSFVFASELPALLLHPKVSRRIHPRATYDYLRWGSTDHSELTMFEDANQLQPGRLLTVNIDDPGETTTRQYWSLPSAQQDIGFSEAADLLRSAFYESVRLHLRSDVQVGSALSGGIDSSAIVAVMREIGGPALELHAFAYVADDEALNEERFLVAAAERAQAIVHRVQLDGHDLVDDVDVLIRSQGEPFGGTSILAQRRVFEAAHEENVTVLLDGQGADELFGGYRSFLASRFATLVRSGSLISAARLARAVSRMPDVSLDRQTVAAVAANVAPGPLRASVRRLAGQEPFPSWCNREWFDERGIDGSTSTVPDGSLHRAFAESSLPALLRYEDRNSMAFSRESRVPFLTPPLAELVFSLPREHLVSSDGTTKLVFREAMRGLVPDQILERRDKIGFSTPEHAWLREHRGWVDGILARARDRGAGPLAIGICEEVAREQRAPSRLANHQLWRWVNFLRWSELFDVHL